MDMGPVKVHMSVCTYTWCRKGANNNLQFPLTGLLTVQVMNWKRDIQRFERSIEFDDDTPVEDRNEW